MVKLFDGLHEFEDGPEESSGPSEVEDIGSDFEENSGSESGNSSCSSDREVLPSHANQTSQRLSNAHKHPERQRPSNSQRHPESRAAKTTSKQSQGPSRKGAAVKRPAAQVRQEGQDQLECSVCGQFFATLSGRQMHEYRTHQIQPAPHPASIPRIFLVSLLLDYSPVRMDPPSLYSPCFFGPVFQSPGFGVPRCFSLYPVIPFWNICISLLISIFENYFNKEKTHPL